LAKGIDSALNQKLRNQYYDLKPQLDRFLQALSEQLAHLLNQNNIVLGIPLEHRVKTWESIAEKTIRRHLTLNSVLDLEDLVGVRLILLFKRDVTSVHKLLSNNFKIIKFEDTSTRLDDTQFGYMSVHYLIGLPDMWLKTPTLSGFKDYVVEVQVRTLAQHIWAASTHELQYKNESGVPLPVRRTINRVAALLETVDLEFERVLSERETYVLGIDSHAADSNLNVDLLKSILDDLLPAENKEDLENYGELLQDLAYFKIDTAGHLRQLIESYLAKALDNDKERVENAIQDRYLGTSKNRNNRGVFYTHVGLIREILHIKFEKKFDEYSSEHLDKS
jgi:putative GTP pyrophosphokinase